MQEIFVSQAVLFGPRGKPAISQRSGEFESSGQQLTTYRARACNGDC
jgi:hypothetical protein